MASNSGHENMDGAGTGTRTGTETKRERMVDGTESPGTCEMIIQVHGVRVRRERGRDANY